MGRISNMSSVVIRVENLSKEYRLGTISHGTLYRDLQSGWAKFRGNEDPNARIGSINREQLNSINDRFCALKDVSFDVRQGEIIGIIGRNGAGKSTLLKIISRVTAPTSGTIKIKGRVASLLEVGTGFHPELTGRENIFLNGAILGMQTGEIEQKFDEIVNFSEINKFIDTPVKRYSSGMYVRLAFAVAAHLDPDILVVDEVLAVGDAQFQDKCLGKMKDVSKGGRTVLFVSHQMSAVENLCSRVLLIDTGKIAADGPTREIIPKYLQKFKTDAIAGDFADRNDREGTGEFRFQKVWLTDNQGNIVDYFHTGERLVAIQVLLAPKHDNMEIRAIVTLTINDVSGFRLIALRSEDLDQIFTLNGPSTLKFQIHRIHLMPGIYICNLFLGRWGGVEPYDFVENAFILKIEPGFFLENCKTTSFQPEKIIVDYSIDYEQIPKGLKDP